MIQDEAYIIDNNAEEMIDVISSKLLDGAEAKSDLEKMVDKLCIIGLDNLEAYVFYRNKIIEYIQSFYV